MGEQLLFLPAPRMASPLGQHVREGRGQRDRGGKPLYFLHRDVPPEARRGDLSIARHAREIHKWTNAIRLGIREIVQLTRLRPRVELIPRWRVPRLSLSKRFPFLRLRLVQETRWPVVDLSLFKRLPFSASSLVSLLVGAALIIAMANIPLFVDTVLRRQINEADIPLVSGLALLRLTAMIPVGAVLGGWLSSRISCRFTGVLGLLFVATGFYLMSRWPMNVDWTQITISTMTTGLGFGLVHRQEWVLLL